MKESYGEYVIHQAATEGKLELIKYFHGKRYPLNKKDMDGETPIFLAAIKGSVITVVEFLGVSGEIQ